MKVYTVAYIREINVGTQEEPKTVMDLKYLTADDGSGAVQFLTKEYALNAIRSVAEKSQGSERFAKVRPPYLVREIEVSMEKFSE